MYFGHFIRTLRVSRQLVLRKLAAELNIDTATMSKIERGDRKARKEHIAQLAKILDYDETELTILWNADIVYHQIKQESNRLRVLEKAKEMLENDIENP